MQGERTPILAQNRARLTVRTLLRRLALFALLPFVGVVAAFGFAPTPLDKPVAQTRVIEEVAPPAQPVSAAGAEGYWRQEQVRRGDTVAALLARLGADDPEALKALVASREAAAAFRQLVPGRTVHARVADDGRLLALRYRYGDSVLAAERRGEDFSVHEKPAPLERRVLLASGEIRGSLFAATDAAKLSDAIAIQIADIFSTDIDFHRDLRKGDRFAVLYEMWYDGGEPARTGRVLAAEFVNQGKTYRAVWFEHEGGRGYYTPEGKNIRKAFLRSPLEFSRITSGFTHSRFHPILKQWRAHRGIDYGAPHGTRVKATGDGIVEFAGRDGAYGNLIVLRHQSKYTTWYAHLSGFAKGIRKGARVAQGEVIGYVGATGLATGPHLHYEFRINGVHHDPLRVVLPSAPPIAPAQKPAFAAATRSLVEQLELLRGLNVAQLD